MQKFTITTLICLLLMSCGQTGKTNNSQTKGDIPKRNMDKYLEDIFISKYPNYMDNELVRDKATKELKKVVDSLYRKKYLEDIPLKVFKVRKNPHGKGAIVQFYADNKYSEDNLLSNDLGFDIIAFMNEELASTLSENSETKYYVYGHKYNRATQAMVDILVDMTYYSTETLISTASHSNKFNIGNFICEVDSLK